MGSASLSKRINIPISKELRQKLEALAKEYGISLAELGREAIVVYCDKDLARTKRRIRPVAIKQSHLEEGSERTKRRSKLALVALKNADLINSVAEEWKHTETDGLSFEN